MKVSQLEEPNTEGTVCLGHANPCIRALLPIPAPRSLPARSMKDSLPTVLAGSVLVRSAKHKMEWELQEGRQAGVSTAMPERNPPLRKAGRVCLPSRKDGEHTASSHSPRRLVVGTSAARAACGCCMVAELLQHCQAAYAHLTQPHHLQG